MDNPATQPGQQPALDIPSSVSTNHPGDDSSAMSEAVTSGSWDSESAASDEDYIEDSNESEIASPADEDYWEEDSAADAWLARYPGGTRLLYPRLFVVKPRGGKVVTPSRHLNRADSLLSLPAEIRSQIYKQYFDRYVETRRLKEEHDPFLDRDGNEIQRIRLSSDDTELKFWLSTALLQTSRQMRFEAMPILFENRVVTAEWLLVLPRFVEFLGKEGCAMVRYLDIWDTLDLQGSEPCKYRDIITSISHFPHLQHLRIILSFGTLDSGGWGNRTRSWFDANEWTHAGDLEKHAVPKMRSEDLERYWPEWKSLKNLRAQKFTLAVESIEGDRYLEFDRNYGAYPGISKSLQSHSAPQESASALVPVSNTFVSTNALEVSEAIETKARSHAFTPCPEFDDEDCDSPAWQDTDTLANKTIPLYNFLREFFHLNTLFVDLSEERLGEGIVGNFVSFPTAQKSTGSIMRDCAFCYLSERHCGYHAVPDQPPYEPLRFGAEHVEDSAKTLGVLFKDLSYVDMRKACRAVADLMEHSDANHLFRSFHVFDYLGWFETPISERLARLDAAVEAGWVGKRIDKEEVPPWDMLYRELHSRFICGGRFRSR